MASNLGIDLTPNSSSVLGGVSFFDFDNDGWDDLTFASKGSLPVKFYKNQNGTFQEIDLGINVAGHSKQVIWVDYDNDGDNDLFITRIDANNRLFRNNGSMQFTDVTNISGLSQSTEVTYGATFGDFDQDGYLDLFVCNKDENKSIPNKLYKNNGDGTFSDVSVKSGISTSGHLSFCATFFDFNNDGYPDIYISNDRYANLNILYKNNGDGTFTDVSATSGAGIAANAMSTTIADYNGDGFFDIYITNTVEGNFLLKNNGNETFTNVAVQTGTVFNTISWGALFFDAENDADLDLYVSSMLTDTNSGMLPSGFYVCDSNGDYSIPSNAGFQNDAYISFANAMGDANNDGLTDFSVSNRAPDNSSLWMNSSATSNNWIKIELKGVMSNRNGVGNLIEVRANGKSQYKQTMMGESYLGQNSTSNIFGLSDASNIQYIKVTWANSGLTETYSNITPNQKVIINESSGILSDAYVTFDQITVGPNPVHEKLWIKNLKNRETQYRVYSLNGRLIQSGTLDSNEIDLQSNSAGIYVLQLYNKQSTKTFRIIKN